MDHGFDNQGQSLMLMVIYTISGLTLIQRNTRRNQATDFVVEEVNVESKLTCGEHIANLGGIPPSLCALKSRAKFFNIVDKRF